MAKSVLFNTQSSREQPSIRRGRHDAYVHKKTEAGECSRDLARQAAHAAKQAVT